MKPLLTIAIPTFNREKFLRINLNKLADQIKDVPADTVEVLVSDNCSSDNTGLVVKEISCEDMPIVYIKNKENFGWARNFSQAFDLSKGKYILMMGDDDLLVSGALKVLYERINTQEYGVICIRPYGYNFDYKKEMPKKSFKETIYDDSNRFLLTISQWFTLTSAVVLNKDYLTNVDSKQFINTDLATFHLMLRAALSAEKNIFINSYMVASKRQNSFSYEYCEVFVNQFWRILESHKIYGIQSKTLKKLERKRLFSYYPFYIFDLQFTGRENINKVKTLLENRFKSNWLYLFWIAPTLYLPRPLAIAWGGITVSVGRIVGGDFMRGLKFLQSRFLSFLR